MFGSKKNRGSNSSKKPKNTKEESEIPPPPEDIPPAPQPMGEYSTDMNGVPYGDTEMALIRLHSNLTDFYWKHKPENTNEEVLTILMQFYIDAGGAALNRKLMKKYGEDLATFRIAAEEPPPPPVEQDMGANKTMMRVKRQSQRHTLKEDLGIDLPPPPAVETNFDHAAARQSLESRIERAPSASVADHVPKKKLIKDPEYRKFIEGKVKEHDDSENDVNQALGLFSPPPPELEITEDEKLKLHLLDRPDDTRLTPRDLIEAFYSKHDESKLDSYAAIDKFVIWVEEHSLRELSEKLKNKYGEYLEDMTLLARRRKNLEDKLTIFYLEHDRPKLDTRWTIMKILSWTMSHGVDSLNRKFVTRYGYPVIGHSSKFDDVDV